MRHNFQLCLIFLALTSCVKSESVCDKPCHKDAACKAYESGQSCCKCNEGYLGNGQHCYQKDASIIVRGNLNGELNSVQISDQYVYGYVSTLAEDARNNIAIGPASPKVGNKLSLLLPLIMPINWLLAGDAQNQALNGFALTGGVFSRQSESTFLDADGNVAGNLYVQQNFTGLYENSNELHVDIHVSGQLPSLAIHEQVVYRDFNTDYQYRANVESPDTRKVVESKGSIEYVVTSIRHPTELRSFRIEHSETLHFSVCHELNEEKLAQASALVKLATKGLFVTYTNSEKFARFSSANFVKSQDDPAADPCNLNDCSVFAECAADEGDEQGYHCNCKAGFDGNGTVCVDVDECLEGTTHCSQFAECVNLLSNFECKCIEPRVGDGRTCEMPGQEGEETGRRGEVGQEFNGDQERQRQSEDVCARCDPNAACHYDDYRSISYCRCKPGYAGNGFICEYDKEYYARTSEEPVTDAPESTRTTLSHSEKCEQCHAHATCEIQSESSSGGECCVCLQGYVGNGKYCFKENEPVLLKGKIVGELNGIKLDDLDVYSYVLTHSSDSRNFVAIGKIPFELGGSVQVLIGLVSPINWLFAGRNGNVENSEDSSSSTDGGKLFNGFQLTGGAFTRRSTLTFYDEEANGSTEVKITQQFYGYDTASNEIHVHTEVAGRLPTVDMDAQVVFKDYKQEFSHAESPKGLVRSSGELNYKVTSTINSQVFQSYKVEYVDEIEYSQCPHASAEIRAAAASIRVSSKRVQITYTKGDGLVRFTSANYMYGSEESGEDPCAMNACSVYAECLVDYEAPKNHTCACKVGFDGDGANCYDVDECQNGQADCDDNAVCYNLVGHFECRCRAPFTGNGKQCHYDLDCRTCDPNARCIETSSQKACVCSDGYVGDGFQCTATSAGSTCQCTEHEYCARAPATNRYECRCKAGFEKQFGRCVPLPCNQYSNCNENARCDFSATKGTYQCKCVAGYHGDGYICSEQTCDMLNNCHDQAECIPDSITLEYRCVCLNGYLGNGYDCVKDVQSCNVLRNCHVNAECLNDDRTNRHFCKCKPGFAGDGYQCSAINSCRNARSPYDLCDVNADCVFDAKVNDFLCKCKSGYEGNGLRSRCFLDASSASHLVYAQGASLHKLSLKASSEADNHVPLRSRIVYVPGQTAVALAYDCHEGYVYWSDVSGNSINRIRLDGTNFSTVLTNVRSAEGLAIDWISRNMYFADSETRTIEVVSLSGAYRKALIKSRLHNPRGVAVDPVDGYIFWTDWNRKAPKIERANMDGTHRRVIVAADLGVPNGLYFDAKRQEVCWGDAKTKRIECAEKDGSHRRLVTEQANMYPFDLTEVRANIYWSDWSRKAIQQVDKDGVAGAPIKLAPGGNGRVYGLAAVKSTCSAGATNACFRTNGDCNQLCLPKPDHMRQCACADEGNTECLKTLHTHN